ncbi:ABC transporter ATP-binding protein [Senegalia massiliensis]|uniref:ABC transporter ATP-binding protein n=1 Tax=Senegalia massiliensis TaxID=1720316 RepID=UPI001F5F3BCB|nr:ABC transporter ATP-binding protein [Senegalia massiliensis]
MKKNLFKLIIGFIISIFISLLILPIPFLTRIIIDEIIPNYNQTRFLKYILIIICVYIIQNTLRYVFSNFFYIINSEIMLELRRDIFNKVVKLKLDTFKSYSMGEIITRIENDTAFLTPLLVDSLANLIKDILIVIVGIISMFYINKKMTVIALVIFLIYSAIIKFFNNKIKLKTTNFMKYKALEKERLIDCLKMFKLIKIFKNYEYSVYKYTEIALQKRKANIDLGKTKHLYIFLTNITAGALPIITITLGCYEIFENRLTIGSLLAFNSFLSYTLTPISKLASINFNIQKSIVSLERLNEILNLDEDQYHPPLNQQFRELSLSQVSYSYNKNKILNDASINIKKGDKIAIIGKSGVGKTTLLNILSGLIEINSGSIILNGELLNNNTIYKLKNYTTYIEQDSYLFNDTILNNIIFSMPNATNNKIEEVIKIANLNNKSHSNILNLNTIIERGGENISLGQMQRVRIARALLSNADIILLDESTSNIDLKTENEIYNSILKYYEDKTIILVTHKYEILNKFEKIYEFKDGELSLISNHIYAD